MRTWLCCLWSSRWGVLRCRSFFARRSASCLYFSSQVLLLCSNNLNFSPTLRTSSSLPFLLPLLLSHPSSASPPILPLWFYRVLFGVLLLALFVHHILIPFTHCLLSFRPLTLSFCPFTACVFMITLWIDCLYWRAGHSDFLNIQPWHSPDPYSVCLRLCKQITITYLIR